MYLKQPLSGQQKLKLSSQLFFTGNYKQDQSRTSGIQDTTAQHSNNRGRMKTPKALKANVKTYRVDKSKESGTRKRDLFLAGTGKKQIASSGGEIKRDTRNRKKKKKRTAKEHPLAKAFANSLSQTTSHISAKLPQDLSDKLQITLSRITAMTARSMTYLTAASELKIKLFTSSPLLSVDFKEEIVQFRKLTREKKELLDELWMRWVECIREIEKLGGDEGIPERKDGDDPSSAKNQHKPLDKTTDDEEFDRLVEEIKVVGRVWSKKMEDSEKKIADEFLQQQQLAATALL